MLSSYCAHNDMTASTARNRHRKYSIVTQPLLTRDVHSGGASQRSPQEGGLQHKLGCIARNGLVNRNAGQAATLGSCSVTSTIVLRPDVSLAHVCRAKPPRAQTGSSRTHMPNKRNPDLPRLATPQLTT